MITVSKPGKESDIMHSPFIIAKKYFRYRLSASNGKGHGIHSPFVYDFIIGVLNDKTRYPSYNVIENLRKRLLSDRAPVPMEDHGAGSASGKSRLSQDVATITARMAKSPKYAQLLFRMVRHYQPHYVLELGTSLGISTAYLASAEPRPVVTTAEGNYALAAAAQNNFNQLALGNIRIITGNFDNTLPQIIAALPQVDMAFVDGNHREQPTISYFHQLLHAAPSSSMFVFDDIHWSQGMENAWKYIREHPAVMLSIDLFQFGIIFFRPEFKVKQHFTIRF